MLGKKKNKPNNLFSMNFSNIINKNPKTNNSIFSIKPMMGLKNAPFKMQMQWKNMTPQFKNINRMMFKDTDKDGVPDRWDCQPMNRFRQDDKLFKKFKPEYYDIYKPQFSESELIDILHTFYGYPLDMLNDMNYNALRTLHSQKLEEYLIQKKQEYNIKKGQELKQLRQSKSSFGYYQRPEVKELQKKYRQRPEVKELQKKYRQRPEVKEYMKEYYQRPEIKERQKNYALFSYWMKKLGVFDDMSKEDMQYLFSVFQENKNTFLNELKSKYKSNLPPQVEQEIIHEIDYEKNLDLSEDELDYYK